MNLQIFGIFIIVIVALGVIGFSRRGRETKPGKALASLFGAWTSWTGDGSQEDLVDQSAQAIIDASQVIGKVRRFPIHVQICTDAQSVDLLKAHLVEIHGQMVESVNVKAKALARRNGETFKPVEGLVMNYPLTIGPTKIRVSFTPLDPSVDRRKEPGPTPLIWPVETGEPTYGREVLRSTSRAVPPTDAPRRLAGTVQQEPEITVTATIKGRDSISASSLTTGRPLTFSLGRDPSNTLVFPNVPGISAQHATLTLVGGGIYVTDVSRYGTWLETGQGWEKLSLEVSTPVPVGARLSLDVDHFVVVSIENGAAL